MSPEQKLDEALQRAERASAGLVTAINRNMRIMWLLGFGMGIIAGLLIGIIVR